MTLASTASASFPALGIDLYDLTGRHSRLIGLFSYRQSRDMKAGNSEFWHFRRFKARFDCFLERLGYRIVDIDLRDLDIGIGRQ